MKNTAFSQQGFTLVELSIVMIIIGLLIGGILKGQELIQNARLASVISKIETIKVAYNTFQDSYGGLPGDLPGATRKVPDCNGGSSCLDGDGNLKIGNAVGAPWGTVDMNIDNENSQFWKHLALANILGGLNGYASTPDWGSSHPSSALRGGFLILTASGSQWGYPQLDGPLVLIRNAPDGTWACNIIAQATEKCALTPLQAYKIDSKIDDGNALSGSAGSISSGSASGCGTLNTPRQDANGFDLKKTQPSCDMMIKLQ